MLTARVGLALLVLLGLAVSASAITGDLIVNGSFEQASGRARGFHSGSTAIDGWVITGEGPACVDWIHSSIWQAALGVCCLDLNGSHPGGIKQTVATTPGVPYTLVFSMAANPDPGTPLKTLVVLVNAVQKQTFTFDGTGATNRNMRWSKRHLTFTPKSARTTIAFQSRSPGPLGGDDRGRGPALDNVQLYRPNRVPTTPTAGAIEPVSPIAGQRLTASASGSTDADGDPITHQYVWERSSDGGTSWFLGPAGAALSGSRTRHNQQWRFRVRARDWLRATGWVTSASVIIGNAAPTQPTSVTVSPASPVAGDSLTGACSGVTDPDHDRFTFEWQWWKSTDGSLWQLGPTGKILNGSATVAGEYWEVAVRATDGTLFSAWTFSNPLQIASAPPAVVMTTVSTRGPVTQIVVNLSAAASVQVAVLNMAGRTVALLPPKALGSGVSTLLWNGRSSTGTLAPTGGYMIAVEAISPTGSRSRCLTALQR